MKLLDADVDLTWSLVLLPSILLLTGIFLTDRGEHEICFSQPGQSRRLH